MANFIGHHSTVDRIVRKLVLLLIFYQGSGSARSLSISRNTAINNRQDMKDESKSGRSLCSSIFTRLIANDAIISCVQHCQRSAAALDRQANSLPVSNPLTPSCRPPYFEILKACAPSLVANCAIVPDSTDRLLVLPTASTPDVIRRQMAPYLSAAAVQASSPSHWLSDDNWRPKRRYTDMTDVCTMFHCSGKEPGTFEHIECATRNHCITLRRR